MPDNTQFKDAPKVVLAQIVQVFLHPADPEKYVYMDEYEAVQEISINEFARRAVEVTANENGGIYSLVSEQELQAPRGFVMNAETKEITLEGFDVPYPLAEFRKQAVRVSDDGTLLCSMAEALYAQYEKCKEKRASLEHMHNIREMSDLYENSVAVNEIADHHMYNLISSEASDGLSFQEVIEKITKPDHADGPVFKRFNLPQERWIEVREIPTYMREQIRFAFDTFMRPYLGDYPDDRVVMTVTNGPRLSMALEDVGIGLEGTLPPFESPNLMRGYKTSPVSYHRGNGVDMIIFSDFATGGERNEDQCYAYAWPTEEGANKIIEKQTIEIAGLKF